MSLRGLATEGQMTVELAVMVPVVIVVAIAAANLVRYVELCAQFDRLAPDMVIAHGVAPAGEMNSVASVGAVQAALENAMGSVAGLGSIEINVSVGDVSTQPSSEGGITFPISPLLSEFVCTLNYRPWPSSFVIAGIVYESPVALSHSRAVVVDRFRPGVVV